MVVRIVSVDEPTGGGVELLVELQPPTAITSTAVIAVKAKLFLNAFIDFLLIVYFFPSSLLFYKLWSCRNRKSAGTGSTKLPCLRACRNQNRNLIATGNR